MAKPIYLKLARDKKKKIEFHIQLFFLLQDVAAYYVFNY